MRNLSVRQASFRCLNFQDNLIHDNEVSIEFVWQDCAHEFNRILPFSLKAYFLGKKLVLDRIFIYNLKETVS